tara:strand:- start:10468 stop:11103 length:636 start_codon:yes stop_codon:yes gene_type:complete
MIGDFTLNAMTPPQPVGWLEVELAPYITERLQSYIKTAEENPEIVSNLLAGNISKSLNLEDKDGWFYKTVLSKLIVEFAESYPDNYISDDPFTHSLWVNYQKETEFNPFHSHGGVFSFVVWIKIPTDWREQHALPISANSNLPCASDFEFVYTTMLGDITRYRYTLDDESEGRMLFFPAKLKHSVYPFYNCDKERISISGNIWYDTNNNID